MINEPKNTFLLEAAIADALATNAVILPQNLGTNQLDYYWKKYGSGLGTTGSPAIGWESRIPFGQELHGTNNIVYGVTNSASGFAVNNETTQNFTQIYGHGATLKYWGTGLCPWLVDFNAGAAAQLGLMYCHFENFKLDCRGSTNTNQATGALRLQAAHHTTVQNMQVIGAGTNAINAVQVAGCTDSALIDVDVIGGSSNNPSCSNFAHHFVFSGALNTFYGAYFPTTVGVFKIYSSTAAGSGVTVESTFGSTFFGASESSIAGYGLEVGTNSTSLSFTMDFESNGPPTAIVGVHSAVWLQTGTTLTAPQEIFFNNSTSFDGAFRIDSGVTGLTIKGGSWGGATNNTNGSITVDSAKGMDPVAAGGNWQGNTANVSFKNRITAANSPDSLPEIYLGSTSGTNGVGVNSASFGVNTVVFYNVVDRPNLATRYILENDPGPTGATTLNGAAHTYIRVGGNNLIQCDPTLITLYQNLSGQAATFTTLTATTYTSPFTINAVGATLGVHNTDTTGGSPALFYIEDDRIGHHKKWTFHTGYVNFNSLYLVEDVSGTAVWHVQENLSSFGFDIPVILTTLNGAVVDTGTANKVFATPSGGSGAPTLRALVAGDIPALPESGVTNLTTDLAGKVGTGRQILTTAPITGGGDLSADRTIAISDFVGSGGSHARGAVPDPGASAGTTKFLREDASWAVPPAGGGGLTSAYVTITDGTTPANASAGDTFKLRSANSMLTIVTANNDVTHGDNALYTIVVAAIDHNSLNNLTAGDVHTQYLNVNGRSGGQIVNGGTGASETLNIQSTSHVTKGSILLGPITVTSAGLMSGAADPVSAQDLATKKYTDALAAGLQVKGSVQAATTAALPANTYVNGTAGVGATLTGNSNGALAAQDGVTLGLNDLFLVKNEATASHNGIYKLTQVGTGGTPYIATRATNNDEATEITGAYVMVLGGTTNIDQGWIVNSAGPYTIGTTAITWTQFTGVADITFTAPLSKSGNTVSIPFASGSSDGYLAGSDWTTFNNKVGTPRNINTTAPITGGGDLSADRTIAMAVSSAGVNGYLSGTDWSTFNNKVATSRTISTTAPITGGGDLSANRTLAIAAATTSVDGYLTSTDWNTFNGKVATSRSISTTAPLTGGGDLSANRTFAITLADATHDGYLSQTDWAAFNGFLVERSVTFDGGGGVLTAGTKVRMRVPYAGTIQRVTMLADVSGSAVVGISKVAYSSYTGAGSGTSIVASAPPTITSATKAQDATLTGWTLTVAANDVLEFSITSATTITQLEVSLEIKRT